MDKQLLEELESKNKRLEEHIYKLINEPLEKRFGSGKIQSIENGKYYHGTHESDNTKGWSTEHFKGKKHFFWEYNEDWVWRKNQTPDIMDTKNAKEFCSNCKIDDYFSKRKRTHKIYQCLGHEL